MSQEFSSAATCVRQIPAIFKKIKWTPGTRNLDYGGGKFLEGTKYLAGLGVQSRIYDPYNQDPFNNAWVLKEFQDNPADTATLANVLNVIQEPEIRKQVLQHIKDMLKPEGHLFISCYRGRSNFPGPSKKGCWQENRPIWTYLSEVQAVFPGAWLEGGVIIALNS